jgi:simple sugar transport system ATP-binding protein
VTGPALALQGVTKRFAGIPAVEDVSLSVEAGEVLALVGENGAGKSTLVSIACGVYRQDSGTVRAFGSEIRRGDPRAAIDSGIGAVHQHFMLVPPLRVWENVVLGREPRRLGLLDADRARREVRGAAERAGLRLDVDAPVEALGVAAQQRVEIVKQLWRGARVLILDEPTSLLAPAEIAELLRTVRELARSGRAVLFISHKLREVRAVADRVAVLRRGRIVLTSAASAVGAEELAAAVMGGSAPAAEPTAPLPPPGPPRLQCIDLRCRAERGGGGLRGATFAVARGEILGVAGVEGNGQAELVEALCGLRSSTGTLRLDGHEDWARTPLAARRSGVVHLPDDPRRRALCLPLTSEENVALGWHRDPPHARGPLIDGAGRRGKAEQLMRSFDVRPPDPLARAGDLSGGNQQKLVAARELEGGPPPKLVVAAQPTRGLDLAATRRLHEALRSAARAGAAVIVVSSDLDELRTICHRIAVLFEGRIAGEADPAGSDEVLGRLMLGHGNHAA